MQGAAASAGRWSTATTITSRRASAWPGSPTPKTVVRSGFGIFSGRDENIGVARRLPNNPPFITSATFAGDQNNPAFLLKDGFPANALSLASGSADVNNWPINNKLPYVLQWNVNIERQLPSEFVMQVG